MSREAVGPEVGQPAGGRPDVGGASRGRSRSVPSQHGDTDDGSLALDPLAQQVFRDFGVLPDTTSRMYVMFALLSPAGAAGMPSATWL